MRQFPSSFSNHLAQTATTLCTCWILRRTDGVSLGFTDHDRGLMIEGVSCEPISGFTASESMSDLGFAADNHEILGAIDDSRLTAEDLAFGRYDRASVEMYKVNWQASDDAVLLRKGILGEISREDGVFRAEVRSVLAKLDAPKGRQYSSISSEPIGSAVHGVDLSDPHYSAVATVTLSRDRRTFEVTGLESYGDQHFTHGEVEVISGRLTGQKREVSATAHAGDGLSLFLWTPLPEPLEAGDQLRVVAGFDGRYQTHHEKFDDGVNFRGFPFMPGNDFVLSTVKPGGNNDGGAR